jgi:hypothetical protein
VDELTGRNDTVLANKIKKHRIIGAVPSAPPTLMAMIATLAILPIHQYITFFRYIKALTYS